MTTLLHELRCFPGGELGNRAADEIERMQSDLECERVRLAACGVAALGNTRSCIAERIDRENPYWSASYGDVCRAVDSEIAMREQLENQHPFTIETVSQWLETQGLCAVSKADAERAAHCNKTCCFTVS